METILSALIAGGLALIGVIITNISNGKSIESKLVTAQAVTDTKIENLDSKITGLAEEVRKHNSFADRITKLEVRVDTLEREVKSHE